MKKKQMRELLTVMFKIGCIGFGGGTALIPVIEEEVTEERQLVDEDEFNKNVIVANITPGALPVEIASGIGRRICGIPGMILAALMMALPGAFLTVLIVSLINASGETVLRQILFASAGVTAYIIFMLIEYARGTYAECKKNQNAKSGLFFMFLVFFLTSGKELYQIFGVDRTPVFDVSTVNILLIAFFIIFYTNGQFNKRRLFVSAVISVLYCLCVGEMELISVPGFLLVLRIMMVVLAVYGGFVSAQCILEEMYANPVDFYGVVFCGDFTGGMQYFLRLVMNHYNGSEINIYERVFKYTKFCYTIQYYDSSVKKVRLFIMKVYQQTGRNT